MQKLFKYLILTFFISVLTLAQSQHTIMTYNLLNYPGTDTTIRNPYYRTIFSSIQPDVLVVQEMQSQTGVNGFLSNVLNHVALNYSAGTFIDGTDTDNAIFYKNDVFTFISNIPITTTLRDISEFKLVHNISRDTIRIYSVHLKASTGTDNELRRLEEVTSLRNVTDALPSSANFIVVGDFNIYSSSEAAYLRLIDQTTQGYFIDPLELTGIWNNYIFAPYHTQSTRIRSFGGGSTGGLDDRFDMILISRSMLELSYIEGSTTSYGNDGNHYNDSINSQPNAVVEQIVADALHYASDHLPVYASFIFNSTDAAVINFFYATVHDDDVLLEWTTLTEIDNWGFAIQRATDENQTAEWDSIGFVEGNGTTSEIVSYEFLDSNLISGGYRYRLKQINNNGNYYYSKTILLDVNLPQQYLLYQNYPNPFNNSTVIKYTIPKEEFVTIKVYNILGAEVETLFNAKQLRGVYEVEFSADGGPASGVYFYRLVVGGFSQTKKMMLVK